MGELVLSLFPGIDMLGMGFEMEGFCVVRSPDLIFGQDIRNFHAVPGRFDGVIGGAPCQDFSKARRSAPTGYGLEMLAEFRRVVLEAAPAWWLLENVDRVPDVAVDGYQVQRFDLNAKECGLRQSRLRHFQFGSKAGLVVIPRREKMPGESQIEAACLATEGRKKNRRSWGDFCELQGLPRDFDLPGMTTEARYRAVGNGVGIPVARTVARAIRESTCDSAGIESGSRITVRLCACGCGRPLEGRGDQRAATPACRKRLEKRRKRAEAKPTYEFGYELDGEHL